MTIGKVDFIDPIPPGKKPGRATQVNETSQTDSINISSEAVKKAETYRAMEMVNAAPDVRADRIEELKTRINDPSYINDKVLDATADKLIDALFG
jgi:negative regulator of flagellin synthesis FlgM